MIIIIIEQTSKQASKQTNKQANKQNKSFMGPQLITQ